jgi:DSP-PTPase phosphatase fused to NAD+ Kinase
MRRFIILSAVSLTFVPAARAQALPIEPQPVAPGVWRGHAPWLRGNYRQLREMGFQAVLDIRGNQPRASARERRLLERMGIVYMKAPLGFRPLRDGSGEHILAVLQNPPALPMYVHCNVDRDRSSAVIGVYRVRVQGWSREAAVEEAQSFGLRRFFIGLNRYLRQG